MEKQKSSKWIIVLLVLLIITIITCTTMIVITINKDNQKVKKEPNDAKKDTEEKTTPTPEISPSASPTISFNDFGTSLITDISYMILKDCNNPGDCAIACDNITPVKITDINIIKGIVAQIQTSTPVSSLPDGSPMEVCGGMGVELYYNDNTDSVLWFPSKNYVVYNIKEGPYSDWQDIKFYHSENLYQYLFDKLNELKSS